MKFAYFPGCSLHSSAEEYAKSSEAVCENLGIKLHEIEDWLCCGATPAHITDHKMSVALPITSCAWAEQNDMDVLTTCAACFARLKIANQEVREDETLRTEINDIIEEDYKGKSEVRHLLDVIANDVDGSKLTEAITKPLKGLKVACYYGCLLTRLPEKLALDSQENPMLMDRLAEKMGAEAVQWSYKTECCGASLAVVQGKTVLRLANDILSVARDQGADCIMVACPLCQSNLDLNQASVNKKYNEKYNIPVFYFTQLLGLALGIEPKKLELKKLVTDPMPLLGKKDILKSEVYL
jgi:heterodisulfide reductase subunit B